MRVPGCLTKDSIKLACLFIFICASYPAYAATYPDISGTYSGSISITDFSCVNPADNGSHVETLSITLTGNTSGTFTGTGTATESSGGTTQLKFKNGVNDNTNFSANIDLFEPNDSGTGSVSGTFNATTIQLNGVAMDTGCSSSFSGTLTKTSGTTVSTASPSSTVTETILFNTQVQNTVGNISTHINSAMSGMRTSFRPSFSDNQFKLKGSLGINAGDDTGIPYGMWGNYAYTDNENDLSSTAFKGTSHGFLGGIDFGFWDNTILGVALGYDKSDIDTTFNSGNQDTDSYTIAPYFGALLNDLLSIDFNIGYSRVEYDQYRTAGTTRVTSSPSADRWFGAFNMNITKYIDRWIVGGRVGMLYATSTIDSYTESNSTVVATNKTRVGTTSIAGDVAYSYGDFEPFLNLSYQYDFQLEEITALTGPQPSNDTDDILLTAGVRYFEKSGLTGNLEYSKRLLRDNYNEDRISITVRMDY